MKMNNKKNTRFLAGLMSLVLAMTATGGSSPIRVHAMEEASAECVPGEIVVLYDSSLTSGEELIEAMESSAEVESIEDMPSDAGLSMAVVELEESGDEEAAAYAMQKEEGVLAASPNYILELFENEEESISVNDPYTESQKYLETVQANKAWGVLTETPHDKVRVAVLDTGADVDHEDLSGVLNMELSAEILSSGGEIGPLYGDDYSIGKPVSNGKGHGTHVCGSVAAQANNGIGIAGTGAGYDNSVIDLVAVDVFSSDKTSIAFVIAGLEYARAIGAKVINLSLGIRAASVSNDSTFRAEFESLYEDGIIVVCAAGNYALNDGGQISVLPSDYSSTISVIEITDDGHRGSSSDYGQLKDIGAPGSLIYSTMPGDSYGTKSGTSMSSGIVSGVVAMMCSVNKTLDCQMAKKYLAQSAIDLETPGYNEATAYGLINANNAVRLAAGLPMEETEPSPSPSPSPEPMPSASPEPSASASPKPSPSVSPKPTPSPSPEPSPGPSPEPSPGPDKLPYKDVSEDAWYYDGVKDMYAKGIMTGKEPDRFDPDATITRAEFAVMMYRLEGKPSVSGSITYPDVEAGTFYSDAVLWANHAGVITGYGNGCFGPLDLVTREQIATILYRYAGYKGDLDKERTDCRSFPDGSSVNAYAVESMNWAIAQGVIRGGAGGRLYPLNGASRAECATMFSRYIAQ